jgi:hypothetical protein
MDADKLINSLDRFARIFPAMVADVSADEARWKPADGAWSILEIVRHLGDEEVEDFRARLRSTLVDPSAAWPPIDPESWARQRNYNDADLSTAVATFVAERDASVHWLRGLENPDWSVAYQHPKVGPVSAGDLLTSWAAHDTLHLRQIAKRLYQMNVEIGGRFNAAYAGAWDV